MNSQANSPADLPPGTGQPAPVPQVPQLDVRQYDFELPKNLIAQHPLPNREDARLLVVHRASGTLEDGHVRDLPQWLRPGDALVLNDTQVILAQLVGFRAETRGRWHGLFLEADAQGVMKLLCKTRGNPQAGERVVLQDRQGRERFELVLLARLEDGVWVARCLAPLAPDQLLAEVGRVPLPHYIRGGAMEENDLSDYQTVFAQRPGAVAAPTAGLHFTRRLLRHLEIKGVQLEQTTLHVGVGTFRPMATDDVTQHRMHGEWGEVTEETAQRLNHIRQGGGRIIAVGTTVVRLLESSADSAGAIQPWSGVTELFIHPPYRFRAVDAMMTNFHLPRTTLLVLARTFGGDRLMRQAYRHALDQRYRFFSYGDAMLIL